MGFDWVSRERGGLLVSDCVEKLDSASKEAFRHGFCVNESAAKGGWVRNVLFNASLVKTLLAKISSRRVFQHNRVKAPVRRPRHIEHFDSSYPQMGSDRSWLGAAFGDRSRIADLRRTSVYPPAAFGKIWEPRLPATTGHSLPNQLREIPVKPAV